MLLLKCTVNLCIVLEFNIKMKRSFIPVLIFFRILNSFSLSKTKIVNSNKKFRIVLVN